MSLASFFIKEYKIIFVKKIFCKAFFLNPYWRGLRASCMPFNGNETSVENTRKMVFSVNLREAKDELMKNLMHVIFVDATE